VSNSQSNTRGNPFIPFGNESQVMQWDSLQIENRLDRVSVSGDIDLTKDQVGLDKALALRELLNSVVETLQRSELPKELKLAATARIKNPFN